MPETRAGARTVRDRIIVAAVLLVVALAVSWPALSRAAGWNRPGPPELARAVPAAGAGPARAGAALASARDVGDFRCVEPAAVMRASHMTLLADWRELAVRQGLRRYRASDGREFEISLSGTCLRCHQDKARFCDRCHEYADRSPGCWDCHLERAAAREATAAAPGSVFVPAGDPR